MRILKLQRTMAAAAEQVRGLKEGDFVIVVKNRKKIPGVIRKCAGTPCGDCLFNTSPTSSKDCRYFAEDYRHKLGCEVAAVSAEEDIE